MGDPSDEATTAGDNRRLGDVPSEKQCLDLCERLFGWHRADLTSHEAGSGQFSGVQSLANLPQSLERVAGERVPNVDVCIVYYRVADMPQIVQQLLLAVTQGRRVDQVYHG